MDGEAIWELSVCSDQFFCKLLLKKESLLVSKNKKLKNHDGENVGAYYSVPAWWGQWGQRARSPSLMCMALRLPWVLGAPAGLRDPGQRGPPAASLPQTPSRPGSGPLPASAPRGAQHTAVTEGSSRLWINQRPRLRSYTTKGSHHPHASC